MKELPAGWKRAKVPEAYWFQEGPGVRNWQFKTSGIKLLNVGNITNDNTLDLDKTDRHLDLEEIETKYKHFLVDAGDLVIASSGISFDKDGFLRTRGAFVKEEHLPLCMNTSTIRFKSKEGISDLRYFRYWLQSNEFRSQVSQFVTGSAQLNFGPSHLQKMSISLPPLAEQQRIAAILDKADELRAKRRAALAKLDTLLQATFLHMFGDPVTNPMGWEELTIEDCLKKGYILSMKDGNHGEIHPKVADFTNDGIPFIMASDINRNILDLSSCHHLPEVFQEKLRTGFSTAGDVLLSHKGSIGFTALVPEDIDLIILSPQVTYYRTNSTFILPEYLWGYFQTDFFQKNIENFAKQSTRAYVGITKQQILPIMIPSLNLQLEYQECLKKYHQIEMGVKSASRMQDILFHTLQQRAFKGEL